MLASSLGFACGLADHDPPLSTGAETTGGGGQGANGGAASRPSAEGGGRVAQGGTTSPASGGSIASRGGVVDGDNQDSVVLDSLNCASRPVSDCRGVETSYDSNSGLDGTPAFAMCAPFNSFDGCGVLAFSIDERGCATEVSPGAGGWRASAHLSSLQACLVDALASARFPCLASQRLVYRETCFVR